MQRHDEAVNQKPFFNFVCKIHKALGEVQFVIVGKIFDIGLDCLLRCQHTIIRVLLVSLLICVFSHVLKGFHACLEPHLRLLDVPSSELTCLKLCIDSVSLLILEIEKFLVN